MERPQDSIEMMKGGLEVSVNPQGAWIDRMRIGNQDVLFPKFMDDPEKGKYKGGMHVCLPQFGPETRYGLNQHGYGRDVAWEVDKANGEETILALDPSQTAGNYPQGLGALLHYRIVDDEEKIGLSTHLIVTNYNSHQDLPIAPAFHPYFAHDGYVDIDGKSYSSLLDGAAAQGEVPMQEMPDSFHVDLGAEKPMLVLESEGLAYYAFWTNRPEEYICIEPTALGGNFDLEQGQLPLPPSSQFSFEFTFNIFMPKTSKHEAVMAAMAERGQQA